MSNIKYFYVRNPYRNRDITIASDIVTDGDKVYVKAAWSFRSNHDKFIKKEGRKLALERLNCSDSDYSALIEIPEVKFYDIIARVLGTILVKESTPKKYLDDVALDFEYFTHMAVNGKPSWKQVFDVADRETP